jgi:4-carboxymuconolactone decarboxylase
MATGTESQDYIDEMALQAGFVLDFHKVMAKHDVGVLKAINQLRREIRSGPYLDPKTQELLYVLGYTAAGFAKEHLAWHVRAALAAGASPEEILHALELVLLIAGVVPFMRGVEAWADVTGAQGMEPTVPAISMGNDGVPTDDGAP